MPHTNVKEILTKASEKKIGIANMIGSDIAMTVGICKAAEVLRAPVILCFNQEVNPKIPIEIGIPMIVNAAENSSVEIGTMLDHGKSFDEIKKAIELGIGSVMIDGSLLPFETNVEITKGVVDYAHSKNIPVEGELGCISGSSIENIRAEKKSVFTQPEQALDFIEKTNIDFLAISFGNSHGSYFGLPKLDLSRVKEVKEKVKIPLVMHGASGLNFEKYPEIINAGITKLNYYTAISEIVMKGLFLDVKDSEIMAIHELIDHTIDGFFIQTKRLLTLFGSNNYYT